VDPFFTLIALLALLLIIAWVVKMNHGTAPVFEPPSRPASRPPPVDVVAQARAIDPTFSEPVFLEWATLLFIRAQETRGVDREALRPWFVNVDKALPPALGGEPIKGVRGVVVGAIRITGVRKTSTHAVVTVLVQSCLTARHTVGEQAWYLQERWDFHRKLGLQSRAPDNVERLGCPACGSPVERATNGRCASCGNAMTPGEHDWAVSNVIPVSAETRPPLLEGNVEEQGTQLETVRAPDLKDALASLNVDPTFDLARFKTRARTIFTALQDGWTRQKWEVLRPLETENIFQQHRYWLEEYQRQGLRNVLTDIRLTNVDVVKVRLDPHYQSITCRMFASMRDSTVRIAGGSVVGGDPSKDRPFTEYWTFLRRPGAVRKGADANCPSCGAPLNITQAGVCEYCQSKVTRGQFDWVLSRIEQDDEYRG
jgi:uncharacterized Zn finger protein (UPF0148 family)